ncbi:hypothetical protein M405DRAFT_824027 [Rhizopogon salebrosus TDB-379]|nr:hypothetical protein M405DRAFT_824027 [Rhizopogon salebrosus TDB-379]
MYENEHYQHLLLQSIFRMIEGAATEVTRYKRSQFRQLVPMGERVSRPDFIVAEGSLTPVVDAGNVKWRHICGFIEVKPVVQDGSHLSWLLNCCREQIMQGSS